MLDDKAILTTDEQATLATIGANVAMWAVSGTWSAAGFTALPRPCHAATLLPNGKVLISGGYDLSGPSSTAEVYTP